MFGIRLKVRRTAYQATFSGAPGNAVLADLRRFCRGTVSAADVNNVQATYLQLGRQEVWLRIQSHLNLTEEQIYNLIEEFPNE
jgi:hypothetical protein